MRERLIARVVAVMACATLACSAPFAQPTPTATPTPTPTSTPTPTVTPTPAPTALPDISQVVLDVNDLPLGFIDLPPSQIKSMESALNRNGFMQSLMLYGFYRPNAGESIIGITGLLLKSDSSTSFDDSISLPQVFIAAFGKEMGATQTSNVKTIDQVRGIGDRAGGAEGDLTTPNGTLHMQVVIFRRGDIGVIVMSFYKISVRPLASIVDLATLLDSRASSQPGQRTGALVNPQLAN